MAPEARANVEKRFEGLPISDGVAVARVCLFQEDGRHNNLPLYEVGSDQVGAEKARLDRAVAIVIGRLEALRQVVANRIGPAEAEIFVAQKMILEDTSLIQRMMAEVDSGTNAEAAAMKVFDVYETRLLEVDSQYLKERASDIGELKRRLVDALVDARPSFLCAAQEHCQRGRDRIVVTEELTPALAVELDAQRIRGIVTERGGATSHAAILARAVGVPAVSGIEEIHRIASCGTEILVDGTEGEVVLWPSAERVAKARERRGERTVAAVEPVDGFEVLANISMASEAGEAVAMKAEGIGLFRTEVEFLAAGRLLSEEEQFERYAAVVEAMAGRPVYFRLLDIGGDKPSPLFEMPEEENPQLGCRGARFLLSRGDLLATQARAMARASTRGPIHVMYPMIVEAGQFRALRERFEEAIEGLPRGDLYHGVMFEVPSACLEAPELLEISDFGSIGTNDLVQYLFAVDRNNDRVAYDYYPDRGAFWRLLENLARAAEETGKPLSICGEMAADPDYAARFIQMGVRTVSVGVRHIPRVRRAVAEALAQGKPA